MSDFPKAQQPEILHQINKDQEITSQLSGKFLKSLQLFLKPKFIYSNRNVLAPLPILLYYYYNSYKLQQTLGEEYAYIRQYNAQESVFLGKKRMMIYCIAKALGWGVFGRYLTKKFD